MFNIQNCDFSLEIMQFVNSKFKNIAFKFLICFNTNLRISKKIFFMLYLIFEFLILMLFKNERYI